MTGYHFIQPSLHYVIFIFLLLMMPLPVISIDADQVRAQCVGAFELAFPKQQWTSENDLRAFTANVSTERKEDTYFACPLGGGSGSELTDFSGSDLMDWYLQMFNPNKLQYTEIIVSEVSVTNSVCSMDKMFLAIIGECHVNAMSRLMIEVDEDGKLVKWIDHYDKERFITKLGVCNLQISRDEF